MIMNKNQLIRKLARNTDLTADQAKVVVGKLIDIITESLESGEDVNVSKLGKFYLYHHKSRPVRNPKTNVPMMLSECKSVKFKASSSLNRKIKNITRVEK